MHLPMKLRVFTRPLPLAKLCQPMCSHVLVFRSHVLPVFECRTALPGKHRSENHVVCSCMGAAAARAVVKQRQAAAACAPATRILDIFQSQAGSNAQMHIP